MLRIYEVAVANPNGWDKGKCTATSDSMEICLTAKPSGNPCRVWSRQIQNPIYGRTDDGLEEQTGFNQSADKYNAANKNILFVNTRNLLKHIRIAWQVCSLMRPWKYTCCPERTNEASQQEDRLLIQKQTHTWVLGGLYKSLPTSDPCCQYLSHPPSEGLR